VDEELKAVTQQVKDVEKQIELRVEEDKIKEREKNNVIIHRMVESRDGRKRKQEGR
jgi:hypothetical protein